MPVNLTSTEQADKTNAFTAYDNVMVRSGHGSHLGPSVPRVPAWLLRTYFRTEEAGVASNLSRAVGNGPDKTEKDKGHKDWEEKDEKDEKDTEHKG
jgi:hypothetical protein